MLEPSVGCESCDCLLHDSVDVRIPSSLHPVIDDGRLCCVDSREVSNCARRRCRASRALPRHPYAASLVLLQAKENCSRNILILHSQDCFGRQVSDAFPLCDPAPPPSPCASNDLISKFNSSSSDNGAPFCLSFLAPIGEVVHPCSMSSQFFVVAACGCVAGWPQFPSLLPLLQRRYAGSDDF